MADNAVADAEAASVAKQPDPVASLVAEAASDYVADFVQGWFSKHMHNSPVSRDVDALNHVSAALPNLIFGIKELLKK